MFRTERTSFFDSCRTQILSEYGHLVNPIDEDWPDSPASLGVKFDLITKEVRKSKKTALPQSLVLIALSDFADQYTVDRALQHPSFPIEQMDQFLFVYRNDAISAQTSYQDGKGFSHRFEKFLKNPNIPTEKLLAYLGSPETENRPRWPYLARLHHVLAHPNVPEELLITLIESTDRYEHGNETPPVKGKCVEIIATNKVLPDSVARLIAQGGQKFITSRALTQLVINRNVSQEVIKSLMPNEEGRLKDGSLASISLLEALITNLTNASDRAYVLQVLEKRSHSNRANYFIARFSDDEDTLYRVANVAKSRSVAMTAASKISDPEPAQVLVALRDLKNDSYGLRLRIPELRQ